MCLRTKQCYVNEQLQGQPREPPNISFINKMAADDDVESSSEELCLFYKDREEWKDVTPVPQDDGPHAVVRIAYSERCTLLKQNAHSTSLGLGHP